VDSKEKTRSGLQGSMLAVSRWSPVVLKACRYFTPASKSRTVCPPNSDGQDWYDRIVFRSSRLMGRSIMIDSCESLPFENPCISGHLDIPWTKLCRYCCPEVILGPGPKRWAVYEAKLPRSTAWLVEQRARIRSETERLRLRTAPEAGTLIVCVLLVYLVQCGHVCCFGCSGIARTAV
jgi:hypothetical protein